MSPEQIILSKLEPSFFDLDGVITRTAKLHAAAWIRLCDDGLERRARTEGAAFVPFDLGIDCQEYGDGWLREAGAQSFLAARDISLPPGGPNDGPKVETLKRLGNRQDQYFDRALAQHGVEIYEGIVVADLHELFREKQWERL